jgi:retron-type reverse transcriptase
VTEAKECLRHGLRPCCNPCTAKDIERRRYGGSISQTRKAGDAPSRRSTVADRALQRSAPQVLLAIYEQDFLSCSFGGRTGRGAHQALAALHERIAGGKIEWVLDTDLKNFFGSSSHERALRFVEHRVGDQRLISLNPALAESRRLREWRASSERRGNSARRVNQRTAE